MMGRWLSFLITGIAERSSVFRVYVSNVRIPRSQRTTLSAPWANRYSAAMSHSSMVAAIPRFKITG